MFKVKKIIAVTILTCGLMITFIPAANAVTEDIGICNDEATDFTYNTFLEAGAEAKGVKKFDVSKARVVEITEPLPGSSAVIEGSFIIDAYKGACCTIDNAEGAANQCTKYINVYADTLQKCEDFIDKELSTGTALCVPMQILVSSTGVNLLKFYALQIYIWGASIVGIVAVLIITISGVQIAASGGEEQLSSAKTRIMQSLAGLAILFLSALILYTVNPTFFTN